MDIRTTVDLVAFLFLVLLLIVVVLMPQRHFNWWHARVLACYQSAINWVIEARHRRRAQRAAAQTFPQPYRKVRRQVVRVMRAMERFEDADVPFWGKLRTGQSSHLWGVGVAAAAKHLGRQLDEIELSCFSVVRACGPTPGLSEATARILWDLQVDTWQGGARKCADLLKSAELIRQALPSWCRESETLWLLAWAHALAISNKKAEYAVSMARWLAGGGWVSFENGTPVPHENAPSFEEIAARGAAGSSFEVTVASPGGDTTHYTVDDNGVVQTVTV